MEKILLTFTSVNFTMMTESKLVSMGYDIKTIPTPREISESCGLAIMLDPDKKDEMIELKKELPISNILSYIKVDVVIFVNTIKYLIYFFCVVHVLDLFGVKTDKILATAGIGGVAIGFGAQFIIRDVISGLAIILENQFKVADHVIINGIEGNVQELGLRVTKIRGFDGAIHLISNGQINTVTNLSKENQRIEVKMEVPIKYSLDQYAEIVNEISNELVDKYSDIVKKPELIGVTKMDKNSMTITIWGSCKPESQYLYQREIIRKFIEKAKSKSMDLNCYFVAGDENEI